MDNTLALLTGIDILIEDLKISVHQPSIREISYIGEEGFFIAAQYLCIEKSMVIRDESLLSTTSNFQVFMTVLQNEESKEAKNYVISLLTILFPQFKALFTPQSLILSNLETKETIVIDGSNFNALQSVLKQVFCMNSSLNGERTSYNPVNKKAQEIADKIMKGRQKIAAEKGHDNSTVLGRYVSILTIGLDSMSLESCLNLTMFQMYDLIERYTLYLNWDIDIRSRLAGAKSEHQPEDWMKDIHKN